MRNPLPLDRKIKCASVIVERLIVWREVIILKRQPSLSQLLQFFLSGTGLDIYDLLFLNLLRVKFFVLIFISNFVVIVSLLLINPFISSLVIAPYISIIEETKPTIIAVFKKMKIFSSLSGIPDGSCKETSLHVMYPSCFFQDGVS